MTTLRNVHRSTLAVEVARELERMIVSREWTEGTKIPPEPELVRQLGVSRNTLREAVRALTHQGLLEARPGDGTYVLSTNVLGASLSRRLERCDLHEALEVRHCLEREAARLAAGRRTPEDVENLRRGSARIKESLNAGDPPEEIIQLVFDHHLTIVRAGRNPLLLEIYESIADSVRASIGEVLGAFTRIEPDLEPSERLHNALIEAIAAGEGEEAARLVSEHSALLRGWLGEDSEKL